MELESMVENLFKINEVIIDLARKKSNCNEYEKHFCNKRIERWLKVKDWYKERIINEIKKY